MKNRHMTETTSLGKCPFVQRLPTYIYSSRVQQPPTSIISALIYKCYQGSSARHSRSQCHREQLAGNEREIKDSFFFLYSGTM